MAVTAEVVVHSLALCVDAFSEIPLLVFLAGAGVVRLERAVCYRKAGPFGVECDVATVVDEGEVAEHAYGFGFALGFAILCVDKDLFLCFADAVHTAGQDAQALVVAVKRVQVARIFVVLGIPPA